MMELRICPGCGEDIRSTDEQYFGIGWVCPDCGAFIPAKTNEQEG